jgi:hypothetical protein
MQWWDIVLLLMVSYLIFSIHSVRLVDDGDTIYIVFMKDKYDTDHLPYTSVNKIRIWKRSKK